MEEFTTTFWQDFTIADAFGNEAIQDTFDRAFGEWKNSYKYLTALVIVLNHKLWQHYERGNEKTSRLYDKLWRQSHDYALNHLKDEELSYYLELTD
jgi:hypothetical protein